MFVLNAGGSIMYRILSFTFAVASCAFLVACGNSSMSVAPAGSVPMSLTIGDTPPSGVAVLFFETQITGASLQPSDTSKAAVSVLSSPVEVEFGHLQTDKAFLTLSNVAPDTYQSISLTFVNATMTIVNHSGASTGSSPTTSVSELAPTFKPS